MVNPIYQQDEELLLNPFGSKYLGASEHIDVNSNEFIVQEDTVISVLTGGDASISENSIDYKTSMNLSGVTLKKGALIVAPVGEAFKSITIDSGAIMAYNCVVEGEKPGSFVGLLDDYPDAAAAYSLRKLKADYTGAAIQVRVDTTGQPTYDISFDSNGDLDTTDLLSKVGANDAYVNTWYDQSGGGNDATQGSASNQPQIVSGGIINKVNNISAVDFDGTDNYLETSNFTEIEQPTSYFGVFKFDSNKNQNIFDSSLNARQLAGDNGTNYKFFGGSTITGGTTNTNQNSFNGIFNSTDSLFVNDISVVSGNAGTNGIDKIVIASNYPKTGAFLDGKIQELILYPSDQSANRAAIETNINDYYNVH